MAIRADGIGLFWQDEIKVKAPPVEKIKRLPPERVWEQDDYLPDLDIARAFRPQLYEDWELAQIVEPLVFDSEIYPNYVLFAFRGIDSKKCICFEMDNEPLGRDFNLAKFRWVLEHKCIVNFNGRKFDFVIAALALHGCSTEQLWEATSMLIEQSIAPQHVLGKFKCPKLGRINQIDLIDLTALSPGLKVCAGRLHAKKMQDLPFVAGKHLSEDQIAILFMYCFNDLDNTELLYRSLLEQIAVRENTGKQYKLDLRSHSDPQMAEAIISSELKRITGAKFFRPTALLEGTWYRYNIPHFIQFQTPMLNAVLDNVRNAIFYVSPEDGNIIMPKELAENTVDIAQGKYQMGIGGLHSTEKSICHVADENYFIADTDVTSYYPTLILNAGIAPTNLGRDFLKVYNSIVKERIAAKFAGNNVVAECLKIVVNGTFGKLGSKYSIMYAPNLMLQVTLTGQLSLLMLIEAFELAGIQVISANTDGIVVKCLRSMEPTFNAIVKAWEAHTGFGTEEVRYKGVYSRDVNNYFAVYEKPQKKKQFKLKGVYSETAPKKNAVNEICIDAATAFMATGADITTTIKSCTKLQKFTTMRRVKGGGVKDGVYLGKIIRWYYSTEAQGEIISAANGNKVARSDNGKPCMDLPDVLPSDVDYDWYIAETYKILEEIGYGVAPATGPAPVTQGVGNP
jgi:hypothetical protein